MFNYSMITIITISIEDAEEVLLCRNFSPRVGLYTPSGSAKPPVDPFSRNGYRIDVGLGSQGPMKYARVIIYYSNNP